MSGTDYSFEGLDALEQQLAQMIEKEFPREFEALVIKIDYELQARVKDENPHKTGRLQDSWKVGKIKKIGDEYYIEVYTNVDYAEPVEYGHRTRDGKGFVKGVHMMEIALADIAEQLPAFLQEWLNDFISTHDL